MFDTWEPFLSATIGLLDTESLAKICEIHAAVEKVCLYVRSVLITTETIKTYSRYFLIITKKLSYDSCNLQVASPEQQKTLRLLTKKVLGGLDDQTMARKLRKGMAVALEGNNRDILEVLDEEINPVSILKCMLTNNYQKN